jgi:thioesterase domain-containing protein
MQRQLHTQLLAAGRTVAAVVVVDINPAAPVADRTAAAVVDMKAADINL